ncbi:MAG: ankyrin repeat domain-containing protein [Alphaproteobacteria bacterium]|nr:MAG: ankyrin repeat domain-containing protein [Alphaproteobacteria bacterium]
MAVPGKVKKEMLEKMTALTRACSEGDAEMVRFLLECCADPDERDELGKIPLGVALEAKDDLACFRLLLKAGADPNASVDPSRKMPVLHCAFKSAEAVQLLLDAGADPTECNDNGFCAGSWAKIDLQWGADPEAVDLAVAAADSAFAENMRRFEEDERKRDFTTQEPVRLMRPLSLK